VTQLRRVRFPYATPMRSFVALVLVAERMRRRFPKPVDAGSTPAGDADDDAPRVLVAERIGAGLLNRMTQVRLLPRTPRQISTCNILPLTTNYARGIKTFWPMMRLVSQRRCLRRETDSISVWVATWAAESW
jgi:hypothetical protein